MDCPHCIVDPVVKSKKGPLGRYPFLHFNDDEKSEEMCEQGTSPFPVHRLRCFSLEQLLTVQRLNHMRSLWTGCKIHRSGRAIIQRLMEALMIVKREGLS
jgi:hypothetical protein